jgi:hypothetical protein
VERERKDGAKMYLVRPKCLQALAALLSGSLKPCTILPLLNLPKNRAEKKQLPNGPNDGGLMVMRGTANLFAQYFKEHMHEEVSSHGCASPNESISLTNDLASRGLDEARWLPLD